MDGDEESPEIDTPIPLELSDADARILDELDRQFSIELPHSNREYPPITEAIIDNLFDRILRSICDIYRQRSQVTQLELLTAKEANEDSGGGG